MVSGQYAGERDCGEAAYEEQKEGQKGEGEGGNHHGLHKV